MNRKCTCPALRTDQQAFKLSGTVCGQRLSKLSVVYDGSLQLLQTIEKFFPHLYFTTGFRILLLISFPLIENYGMQP